MILSFLRYFRDYVDLERQLADAAARAIEAEDRVRLMKSNLDIARAEKDVVTQKLEWALKSTANYEARRNGSQFVPFPDMESVSVHPAPIDPAMLQSGLPPRRGLRDIQQEAVMQSRKAAHEWRLAMSNGDQED